MDHEYYMRLAIAEAKKAEAIGEVPIGAVVVKDNQVIGRGYNLRETKNDATAHAEMIAIREASAQLESWRLIDCLLYVTLEPCPMCAGAIIQSRIEQVVFGTEDPKAGYAGTLWNLLQDERLNHQTDVISGILREECSQRLSDFFRQLRKKKAAQKLSSVSENVILTRQ